MYRSCCLPCRRSIFSSQRRFSSSFGFYFDGSAICGAEDAAAGWLWPLPASARVADQAYR